MSVMENTSPEHTPPVAASSSEGTLTAEEPPLLVEFARLWTRGLADEHRLWALFDACTMYMYRPDYFGAPVFRIDGVLATPVFSTLELLTEFVSVSPLLGPENGEDGFDWVNLTGVQFFGLPVRARFLVIDPHSEHRTVMDLATREDPPPLAHDAPPLAIHLETGENGTVRGGLHTLLEEADQHREGQSS